MPTSPPASALAARPACLGLVVEDLRRSFGVAGRPVDVLRGVSFSLAEGEAAALVGPSGSGKSTLLHLVGTLDRPDGGRITLDGSDPFALPDRALARFRNRAVGFVFQEAYLLPQLTLWENVALPAAAFGAPGAEVRARELLERVGLGGRLAHRPGEVSGGERQRAAVARALLLRPRLVLADEPTGSLDAAQARSVAGLLLDLHRAEGGLLLVATHSLELAARLARRLALEEGRCRAF